MTEAEAIERMKADPKLVMTWGDSGVRYRVRRGCLQYLEDYEGGWRDCRFWAPRSQAIDWREVER